MPSSILSATLSKPSLSIVNSRTGKDIVSEVPVSKVSIKLTSKVFRHMLENGNSIVDARVLMPTKVEIETFTKSFDQLAVLNAALLDRESTYTVTSKGIVVPLAMMDSTDTKQTPAMTTAAPQHISFTSILFEGADSVICEQPSDSKLVTRGLTSLKETEAQLMDLATKVMANFHV